MPSSRQQLNTQTPPEKATQLECSTRVTGWVSMSYYRDRIRSRDTEATYLRNYRRAGDMALPRTEFGSWTWGHSVAFGTKRSFSDNRRSLSWPICSGELVFCWRGEPFRESRLLPVTVMLRTRLLRAHGCVDLGLRSSEPYITLQGIARIRHKRNRYPTGLTPVQSAPSRLRFADKPRPPPSGPHPHFSSSSRADSARCPRG